LLLSHNARSEILRCAQDDMNGPSFISIGGPKAHVTVSMTESPFQHPARLGLLMFLPSAFGLENSDRRACALRQPESPVFRLPIGKRQSKIEKGEVWRNATLFAFFNCGAESSPLTP